MEDMHIHLKSGVNDYEIIKSYLERCRSCGLNRVVFLDHGNRISPKHKPVLYNNQIISKFLELIDIVRKEYDDINVFSGIEVDWSRNKKFVNTELKLLENSFDYRLGAVHGIKHLTRKKYYRENLHLCKSYPINVLAHLKLYDDYVKYKRVIVKIVKICAKRHIAIEINSSTRSLWTFDQFEFMMNLIRRYGVCYTIGSDAHKKEDICGNFEIIKGYFNAYDQICLHY